LQLEQLKKVRLAGSDGIGKNEITVILMVSAFAKGLERGVNAASPFGR
jgi:hypothetical protein